MRRLLKVSMCFLLMLGVSGLQGVKAEEAITTYTEDAKDENDVLLSEFSEESITIENSYLTNLEYHKDKSPTFNTAYTDYKDYLVLYQQDTGINTMPYLRFNVNIGEDSISYVKVGETQHFADGYTVTSKIVNNPANDKEFIKTPQDFTIVVEITLKNKDGESVSVEKELNAKVVEVVGKIINRKASLILDVSLKIQDLASYINKMQNDLKVQLSNGTITDVVGFNGEGGGAGDSNGNYGMGLSSIYDLKYLLENSVDPWDLETVVRGHLLDDDNNIVDASGRVIIPFDKREIKEYKSTSTEIKLNAKVGTIPDSAVLESTKRTDLNLGKEYVAYDMNVLCNDEYIQPIGNVDLIITIPENLLNKNLGVYYMDDKGNLEELESTISGNSVSFSTTHFSTYVIMEKTESSKPTTPNTDDKKPSTPNVNDNKETTTTDKKDVIKNTSEVATGDSTNTLPFVVLSLSAFLMMGYVICRKVKHAK